MALARVTCNCFTLPGVVITWLSLMHWLLQPGRLVWRTLAGLKRGSCLVQALKSYVPAGGQRAFHWGGAGHVCCGNVVCGE